MDVTPQRILAFDPGGETGWAFYSYETDTIESGVLHGEHHQKLLQFLHEYAPETIVYERFDYRPYKKHIELEAVEYIGVIKLYSQMTKCPLIKQQQLKDTNNIWDNDKLKLLNLYTQAITHPNDAVRQLLYYITYGLNDSTWLWRYSVAYENQSAKEE